MLFGTPLDGQSAAYVNDRHFWLDLASDTRVFPAMGQFAKAYVRYHATDCGVWRVKYLNRLPAAPDKKSSIQEQHGFIIGEEYRFQCFPLEFNADRYPAVPGSFGLYEFRVMPVSVFSGREPVNLAIYVPRRRPRRWRQFRFSSGHQPRRRKNHVNELAARGVATSFDLVLGEQGHADAAIAQRYLGSVGSVAPDRARLTHSGRGGRYGEKSRTAR
ncbi:hypothetical protein [Sinorhizobium meliloti]|uniref:hypothetical protein n=1 Tax=Rhizobium meliloti TaxID=382 RepID=UPI003B51E941